MAEFDRIRWAIIVNSLMIVLVAYSILPVLIKFTVTTEYASTLHPLLFYTNWSNILAAVAAGCSIYCIHKGTRMPKAIAVLKLASTMMLTVTFLVVTLLFAPYVGPSVLLDPSSNLFLHLIVPILSVMDLLFLADIDAFRKNDALFALIPMACYTIGIITVLLISGNDDLAPYPFLRMHTQPIWQSILWFIILYGLGFGLSCLYSRLVKRFNPYVSENDGQKGRTHLCHNDTCNRPFFILMDYR